MKSLVIVIMFFAVYFLSGCGKNPREISASTLVAQIPSAWAESTDAFTNVAHKACEAIRKIENPTNRLECAKVYAEALLALDKFIRECDVQGYWARINAHGMAKDILHELDVESKWIHAAKYRQLMRETTQRSNRQPVITIGTWDIRCGSQAVPNKTIKENEQ